MFDDLILMESVLSLERLVWLLRVLLMSRLNYCSPGIELVVSRLGCYIRKGS